VAGGFAKFFAFFVSFAAYSLWFHSWRFGLGLVLLILVHELGHVLEARRQGLPVTLPTFIPFLGAYVTHRQADAPWRGALIALAGPFVGGLGAATVWAVGSADNTIWLLVLANIGFLLNAFNLLPIGFLDGGTVFQSISLSRRGWIRYPNGIPVEAVHRTGSTPTSSPSSTCCSRRRVGGYAPQRDALADDTEGSSRPMTLSSTSGALGSIGQEFFAAEVVEDRPSGRLLLRVGTRAGRIAAVRARPRDRAALRGGWLGRRHGRRAGRDGGSQPRLPRGRRAIGGLRDRAAP
jgi:hypothetical protein